MIDKDKKLVVKLAAKLRDLYSDKKSEIIPLVKSVFKCVIFSPILIEKYRTDIISIDSSNYLLGVVQGIFQIIL